MWTVVAVIGWLLVNGPIFRAVAVRQMKSGLADEGLTGVFELDGTLAGGVRLSGVDLTGTKDIRELKIGAAEVTYSLLSALAGNELAAVERIAIADVTIRVQEQPKETKDPKPEAEPNAEPRPLNLDFLNLAGATLDVRNLDFQLDAPKIGDFRLLVDDLSFQHEPGKPGMLRIGRLRTPDGREWMDLGGEHTWSPEQFDIRDVRLTDALVLRSLDFSARPEPTVNARLEAFGGEITIVAGPQIEAHANLTGGAVDLGSLTAFLGKNPVLGEITKLDFAVARSDAAKGAIGLSLTAAAENVVLPGKKSPKLSLTADANVTIERNDVLGGAANINAEFSGAETPITVRATVPKKNQAALEAEIGPGLARATADIDLKGRTYEGEAAASSTDLSEIRPLLRSFGVELLLTGGARARWSGIGRLDGDLADHEGKLDLAVENAGIDGGAPVTGGAMANYSGGKLTISEVELASSEIELTGTGELTSKRFQLTGLRLTTGEIELATAEISIPVGGQSIWDSSEPVDFRLKTDGLDVAQLLRLFSAKPAFRGRLDASLSATGPLGELVAAGSVKLSDGQIGDAESEPVEVVLNLDAKEGRLTVNGHATRTDIEPLEIRGQMGFHPQKWSENPEAFRSEPIEGALRVPTTDLGFLRASAPWIRELTGAASIDVAALGTLGSPNLTGSVTVDVPALRFQNDAAPELTEIAIGLNFADNRLTLETFHSMVDDQALDLGGHVRLENWSEPEFELTLNTPTLSATAKGNLDSLILMLDGNLTPENEVRGNGEISLRGQTYSGELTANLNSIGELRPAKNLALAGAAELEWRGSGSFGEAPTQTGNAQLRVTEQSIAGGAPVSGNLSISYDPDAVVISGFQMEAGGLKLIGQAEYRDRQARFQGLQLLAGTTTLASAEASVPFDPDTPFWEQAEPVELNLESNDLPLSELLGLFSDEPSFQGILNGKLTASGPPGALRAEGAIRLTECKWIDYDRSRFDLSIDLGIADGKLTLDGQATHEDHAPLLMSGSAGFHPEAWRQDPEAMSSEPLEASLDLTELKLDELRTHLPLIREANGFATVNLAASGTIGEPKLTGHVRVEAPRFRFERQGIPTLTDVRIGLDFDGESVVINEFHGEVAGGPFDIEGKVGLQNLAEPEFELRLIGRETLIARTEDLNLRANGDLSLTGPWKTAALTGELLIAQSRFTKEIEILPLGMLTSGRIPTTGTADRTPLLDVKQTKPPGVHIAPFEDWTLDVHIGTQDPFLIRGNLVRADILSDLKITGTLGNPVPNGKIELLEARATLPFSELDSRPGAALTFTPTSGLLNPEISFRGESILRNYQVQIYVFGAVQSPEYILSSQPPLVESEIVSLLATGSTSSELKDGGVMASKAAILLLQDIFRRVGQKVMPGAGDNNEYAELLKEKVEVNVDTVDVESGRFKSETAVKLTDNVHLIGSMDESGNTRGLLKFIVRLR